MKIYISKKKPDLNFTYTISDIKSKLIGIGPFDYTLYEENCGIEWTNWHRSFEWYLKANKIEDDDDKFTNLMHLAGRKVQELFTTLSTPVSISKVAHGPLISGIVPHPSEYDLALAKLNEFFEPKKNTTYERHMFRILKQEKNEKIGIFAMRLRTQAEKCDFGDTVDSNIKDQIIEKCTSTKLRRGLLKLGDKQLDDVLKAAKVFEAIEEQSKTFDNGDTNQSTMRENVNKIYSKPTFKNTNSSKIECTRCGYTGHKSSDEKCPAIGKLCNKCSGRNHFSRKCRSKKRRFDTNNKPNDEKTKTENDTPTKQENVEPQNKKPANDETVKLVESYKSNMKDEYIFCITNNNRDGNEIKAKIGGVEIVVTIDSGSRFNIIDANACEYLKANTIKVSNQRKETDQSFKGFGGNPLTVVGVFEADIGTQYKTCTSQTFYVLRDYGKVLIGYETGIPLGVMRIGENVNQVDNFDKSQHLSKIKGVVVDIPINPNVKPVAQPYRRIPVPLEVAVDKKLDELEKLGVIEQVNEPSPWISPMVPVMKQDDVRICLDMRRANEAVLRENLTLPTMEDFLPHIGKGKFFTKLDVKNAFHQVVSQF